MVALDGQIAVGSGVNILIGCAVVDHGGGISGFDCSIGTAVGAAQCQSGIARKSLLAVEGGALGHGHGAVSDSAFTVKNQLAVGTVVEGDSGFIGHNSCECSIRCAESAFSGGHGSLKEGHIGAAAHDTVDVGSSRNAEIVGKSMGSGDGQIAVAAGENGSFSAVGHGGEHEIISIGKTSISGGGAVEADLYSPFKGLFAGNGSDSGNGDVVGQGVSTVKSQVVVMSGVDLGCFCTEINAARVCCFIGTEGSIAFCIAFECNIGCSGHVAAQSSIAAGNNSQVKIKDLVAVDNEIAVEAAVNSGCFGIEGDFAGVGVSFGFSESCVTCGAAVEGNIGSSAHGTAQGSSAAGNNCEIAVKGMFAGDGESCIETAVDHIGIGSESDSSGVGVGISSEESCSRGVPGESNICAAGHGSVDGGKPGDGHIMDQNTVAAEGKSTVGTAVDVGTVGVGDGSGFLCCNGAGIAFCVGIGGSGKVHGTGSVDGQDT